MREWKEKRLTMQHYDRQATIYNVQYLGEQNAKIEDSHKKHETWLKRTGFRPRMRNRFSLQAITEKVGRLVGLDVSQKALQEAKKRTKNMQNIVLVRADADNMPFPDHIFDKIFAITVLQNMPDPTKTITEMKRSSKSQAMFAVTGLKKKFTSESFAALLESAQLKVVTLDTNQRLKGHVAICMNI